MLVLGLFTFGCMMYVCAALVTLRATVCRTAGSSSEARNVNLVLFTDCSKLSNLNRIGLKYFLHMVNRAINNNNSESSYLYEISDLVREGRRRVRR